MDTVIHLDKSHPLVLKFTEIGHVDKAVLELRRGTVNCRIDLIPAGAQRAADLFAADKSEDAVAIRIREAVEQTAEHVGEVIVRLTGVRGFANLLIMEYMAIWREPPLPPQTIRPKVKYPERLSAEAWALLEALDGGAIFHVRWTYRSPQPLLDDKPMPADWWFAFIHELEQKGEGQFFDGYNWLTFGCAIHPYTEEYEVDSSGYGVTVGHRINEAGRKRLTEWKRTATP